MTIKKRFSKKEESKKKVSMTIRKRLKSYFSKKEESKKKVSYDFRLFVLGRNYYLGGLKPGMVYRDQAGGIPKIDMKIAAKEAGEWRGATATLYLRFNTIEGKPLNDIGRAFLGLNDSNWGRTVIAHHVNITDPVINLSCQRNRPSIEDLNREPFIPEVVEKRLAFKRPNPSYTLNKKKEQKFEYVTPKVFMCEVHVFTRKDLSDHFTMRKNLLQEYRLEIEKELSGSRDLRVKAKCWDMLLDHVDTIREEVHREEIVEAVEKIEKFMRLHNLIDFNQDKEEGVVEKKK